MCILLIKVIFYIYLYNIYIHLYDIYIYLYEADHSPSNTGK